MGSSRLPENMTGQVLRIMLMAEEPNISRDKPYDSYLQLAARRERETGSKFTFPGATAALLFLGKRQQAAELVRSSARAQQGPDAIAADVRGNPRNPLDSGEGLAQFERHGPAGFG